MEKDMSGDGDLSLQIEKVFIIFILQQVLENLDSRPNFAAESTLKLAT